MEEKKCGRCRRKLPFSAFHKSKSSNDGFYSICKECRAGITNAPEVPDGYKMCWICDEIKPLDDFECYGDGKKRNTCRKCSYKRWNKKPSKYPYDRVGKVEIKCEVCGKSFYVKPSEVSKRRFCSMKCTTEWRKSNIGMLNYNYKGAGITYTCANCGKAFTAYARSPQRCNTFCSHKCYTSYNSGSNCYLWKNGKSFEPYPTEWTRELKRKIRKRDRYVCAICGEKGNHVHHIDYDKNNCSPDNLITLCNSCHTKTNMNREMWQEKLSSCITP